MTRCLRIVGIDPQIVMVAVRAAADVAQRLAAVGGAERAGVQQVDRVFARRDRQSRGCSRTRAGGCCDSRSPASTSRRHRPTRTGRRSRSRRARRRRFESAPDTATPILPTTPAGRPWIARDLRPRLAAVGRLEQAAARAAARHLVLDAIRLPQRRVHHVGIAPIDRDVDGAGLVVAEQHLAPRLAAVGAS